MSFRQAKSSVHVYLEISIQVTQQRRRTMENKDRYVTPLDILGIQRALQERCLLLEGGFSMARDRTLPDTVASLESFEDLVRRDKEREKDGLPRRIRWSKTLVAPGKVITIPYVEEEKLVHGRFEKNVSAY